MRLSDKNFFRNELKIALPIDEVRDEIRSVVRYGYETENAIYDVDVLLIPFTHNGKNVTRLYGKNMRYISEPEAIHGAIEKHFALQRST